jgi:hypothetical protein
MGQLIAVARQMPRVRDVKDFVSDVFRLPMRVRCTSSENQTTVDQDATMMNKATVQVYYKPT